MAGRMSRRPVSFPKKREQPDCKQPDCHLSTSKMQDQASCRAAHQRLLELIIYVHAIYLTLPHHHMSFIHISLYVHIPHFHPSSNQSDASSTNYKILQLIFSLHYSSTRFLCLVIISVSALFLAEHLVLQCCQVFCSILYSFLYLLAPLRREQLSCTSLHYYPVILFPFGSFPLLVI